MFPYLNGISIRLDYKRKAQKDEGALILQCRDTKSWPLLFVLLNCLNELANSLSGIFKQSQATTASAEEGSGVGRFLKRTEPGRI